MSKKKDQLVLVGFGKQSLTDLMEKVKTPEGKELVALACTQEIPTYRRVEICSVAEQQAFVEYVEFMTQTILELEQQVFDSKGEINGQ